MTAALATSCRAFTLDDLGRLRGDALQALFLAGQLPERFCCLNGRPRGRLLAISGLDQTRLFPLFAKLAAFRAFPLDGKSFASTGQFCGRGVNRLNMWFREFSGLPFHSRLKLSCLDRQPCVRLEYGLERGPQWLRRVHDELREVSPGLYLGACYLTVQDSPRRLFWFALDCQVSC